MILIGNQRGGAKDLATHLLKPENERVDVHEIRGFVADDLHSALQESYAMSRGTRCKQHMFSLSLNPPPQEHVDVAVFEDAIERIEAKLGLTDQPRAIVFHEKRGSDGELRRHAHAVWCRIDTDQMKAVQLSHTHRKLQDISREIYIERDWRMPDGFIDKDLRDPRNFSLAEWQQAKRAEKDPRALKAMFQDCWSVSDRRAGFAQALKERGFELARGDRRGAVAVDHTGEAYAISRWVGAKAKQVRAKLGDLDMLPSVSDAHAQAAKTITTRLSELRAEQRKAAEAERARLASDLAAVKQRQSSEARKLSDAQRRRQESEKAQRNARFRKGLPGFWDRLTGQRRRTLEENAKAEHTAAARDEAEKRNLESRQSQERRDRIRETASLHRRKVGNARELSQDIEGIDREVSRAQGLPRLEPKKSDTAHERPHRPSRDGPTRTR